MNRDPFTLHVGDRCRKSEDSDCCQHYQLTSPAKYLIKTLILAFLHE
jgi:hypothetical protein